VYHIFQDTFMRFGEVIPTEHPAQYGYRPLSSKLGIRALASISEVHYN